MNLINKYLKYKNKYLKYKNIFNKIGGGITQLDSNNVAYLFKTIKEKEYDYVYVSIGSLKSEENWTIGDGDGNNIYKKGKLLTNSIYQMIPIFVRNRGEKKILIIILDRESDTKINNSDLLETELQSLENNTNIDLYKINILEDLLKYDINFIQKLLNYLKCKSFNGDNLVIANYVKFKSQERSFNEIEIDKIIYDVIKDKYPYSYYVWVGYSISCYNYLYLYNNETMKIKEDNEECYDIVTERILSIFKPLWEYLIDNPINLPLGIELNLESISYASIRYKSDKQNKVGDYINDKNKISIFVKKIKNLYCFCDTIKLNYYKNIDNKFIMNMKEINLLNKENN